MNQKFAFRFKILVHSEAPRSQSTVSNKASSPTLHCLNNRFELILFRRKLKLNLNKYCLRIFFFSFLGLLFIEVVTILFLGDAGGVKIWGSWVHLEIMVASI
jgi:hypothetical protein